VEPFPLVRLFNTYLPDFDYRGLTLFISIALGIIGFLKMQDSADLSNLREDAKNYLNSQFWKPILEKSKTSFKDLINSFKKSNSKEPTVEKYRKESLKSICLAAISSILAFTYLPYLFAINVSDFGLFETSFTISLYFFLLFILVLLCIKGVSISTIKQNNGKISAQDLDELLCYLRSELKNWHFEDRVLLKSKKKEKSKDIDVYAISPNNIHFIIELKSHIGDVFWISKLKELRRQYGKNPNHVPFEKDFFDVLHSDSEQLQVINGLSREPNRILLFWRATLKMNKGDRLKRGVLISNKEYLIDDLKYRNNDLIK
ncbi:MAG: hypothetical protein ACRC80_20290, partial [Waterburya sp.]